MDAIVAAIETGAGDEALEAPRRAHRAAQRRWDFVDAENSTGFHSPGEAARLLGDAAAIAREESAKMRNTADGRRR
jgi:nitrite reductase (cytochrome c-552)